MAERNFPKPDRREEIAILKRVVKGISILSITFLVSDVSALLLGHSRKGNAFYSFPTGGHNESRLMDETFNVWTTKRNEFPNNTSPAMMGTLNGVDLGLVKITTKSDFCMYDLQIPLSPGLNTFAYLNAQELNEALNFILQKDC